MIRMPRVLIRLAAGTDIIAGSALPAAAGFVLANHCEPDSHQQHRTIDPQGNRP